MLKAYFDSSGDQNYISLGGMVSSEANWPEFEKHWVFVLRSHSIHEFHMSVAMAKRGQFLGWTDEAVEKITKDLVNVLGRFIGPEFIILKNARKKVFSDPFPRRSKRVSFANSKISGQPQAIDLA
jgi:hypothetical protein